MIYQDDNGYPVEQHGDGGDTSVRMGIILLTGMKTPKPLPAVHNFEVKSGMLTRHPVQAVWNNPWNFTPDQMKPMVAGLAEAGEWMIIARMFLRLITRVGFCQDFDQDTPVNWKRPWPHTYANGRTQNFDFATPLLPNDWWPLIYHGCLYPLYILFPICLLFQLIAVYTASAHEEQNQIICSLSAWPKWVAQYYVKQNPSWSQNNISYWASRGEQEYADALAGWLQKRVL